MSLDSIDMISLVQPKLKKLRPGQTLDVHSLGGEEAQAIIQKYSGDYFVRKLAEKDGTYALNIQVRGGRLQNA